MHLQPSFGKGRAVGEAIVANMFADGDDGASRWSPSPAPTARRPPCA
jgi:hypothetical protein